MLPTTITGEAPRASALGIFANSAKPAEAYPPSRICSSNLPSPKRFVHAGKFFARGMLRRIPSSHSSPSSRTGHSAKARKLVIFTDLDGTLLDRNTYSFEPALPALNLIKQKGVPLILSSSKTRAEIEVYREKLDNDHPFIAENGGAVFIPVGYFSFSHPYDRELEEYVVLEIGSFHPQIIEVLESIKNETGLSIKGFSDLTEEEIRSLSGLSLEEAGLAKRREYGEPFLVGGGEKEIEIVKEKIREKGMNYTRGGKFHHILGKNDKGKATEILKELYETQFFSIFSVGIGDSLNDLPMLSLVDCPIFLNEKDFLPETLSPIQNVRVINGGGPEAWNDAILNVVKELEI